MKFNKEYNKNIESILYSENFIKLKKDTHHGTTKYAHSKRVAYLSFLLAKIFKADSYSVSRAGILHDFFYGTRLENDENSYLKHPIVAANNAINYFHITEKEANIIKSHMYHYDILKHIITRKNDEVNEYYIKYKPKDRESVIVCISDLLVSLYEGIMYKVRYNCALYMLFLINVIGI